MSLSEAEEQKRRELYDPTPDLPEEENNLCDFTGEDCIGDSRYCEECEFLTDNQEEFRKAYRINEWNFFESPLWREFWEAIEINQNCKAFGAKYGTNG